MATPHSAPCFLCGSLPGRWNEPAAAKHPGEARLQMEALRRRCVELERGEVQLGALREQLLDMCAMCQEVIMDLDRDEQAPELIERITYLVHRLDATHDAA